MNNIKFLSIFMTNIIVITTATPRDNKHNLPRLLQQQVETQAAPIATDDGPITIIQGGEIILTVTNNDYDWDSRYHVKINEIVNEPEYGQVDTIDDHNIQYTANPSGLCGVIDKFQYNVIDHHDDRLVSNDASVVIITKCPTEPSSEHTREPTPTPTTHCDYILNECQSDDDWIYYYKCIGESLFEYSCPAGNSCDDENGFPDFDRPCTELYLFDDSEDCC